MSYKRKILLTVAALLIVVFLSVVIYACSIFFSISGVGLDDNLLSINSSLDTDVLNIALFGVDGREDVDGDRSDTIMIASINFKTGDIKVVSVMRDLLAQIPETEETYLSYEKINAAYSYGGPALSIQTLNENFDLNISDYVVVDFDCLVDCVDALGGIDVYIQNEDVLYWTNQYIGDVNDKTGSHSLPIESIGMNHLDGGQALAYCRNRYSDSDYGRTERQREVLSQIAQKAMNMDLGTAISLMNRIYPYIETSLSFGEISNYAQHFLRMNGKSISTSRIPFDTITTEDYISEVSYVIPTTLEDNVKVLHGYLYGSDYYIPSDSVLEISADISSISGHGSSVDWTTDTWQSIMNNQKSVNDPETPEAPESESTPSTTPGDGTTDSEVVPEESFGSAPEKNTSSHYVSPF